MAPPSRINEAEARLGTRLGNYALKEIIGRGGMGVVYLGQHIYIRKKVAVKVLYRHFFDNTDAKRRFLNEAQAASMIDHPNIVGVSDFGEAPDGTVFLVMSFVDGEPMEKLLRREHTIPLFRTLVILAQAARAIGAAHEKNVIHRDVKPENIMLQRRDGRREIVRTVTDRRGTLEMVEAEEWFDFVTVLDFGAARIWDGMDAPGGQSPEGTVLATPYYMAPETALDGTADQRSDIYALGVIFYRALTGTLPFEGDTPREIMLKHVNWAPEPPRERNSDVEISPDAERVILKMLEKQPEHRQQNMEEVYADLQRCYGSVRFRRISNLAPPEDDGTPHPVTRATARPIMRMKLTSGVPPLGARGALATAPLPPEGSAPLLLTRRKTDRHKTLPFGATTPVPPAPDAAAEEERRRPATWPYRASAEEADELSRLEKTPRPEKKR